tara:strand:+ start:2745 stop:3641 length:897 start_codon:yes stop_codon:yes gene_type:complete
MRKILLINICIILSCSSFAQKGNQKLIAEYEDTLTIIANKITHGATEKEKKEANEAFIKNLTEVLSYSKSFKFSFDKLPPTISRIISPKKNFRIFTWFIQKDDKSYTYYGVLHYYNKKDKRYKIIKLTDKSNHIRNAKNKELKPENWYGAYYYDIIYIKNKKKEFYTLLGFNGYDRYSSKKIIEIMHFNTEDEIVFGLPIFNNAAQKKEKRKRIILEHDAKTFINVKYDKDQRRIIFNHLSPPSKDLAGLEEYYIPDGTFDSYNYKKEEWWLMENIDIRTEKDQIKEIKKIDKGLIPR